MRKGFYIIGTNTDIGKTYISALLCKKLLQEGVDTFYYKPVVSGADSIEKSDIGYVFDIANIRHDISFASSYIFKNAYSPHLASAQENSTISFEKIMNDYNKARTIADFLVVESCGGIVCPISYDNNIIMQEDLVKAFNLDVVLVVDSKLGTINHTTLTIEYLKKLGINIIGVIMNNYEDELYINDNIYMIEKLNNVKVIAKVKQFDNEININIQDLLEV